MTNKYRMNEQTHTHTHAHRAGKKTRQALETDIYSKQLKLIHHFVGFNERNVIKCHSFV